MKPLWLFDFDGVIANSLEFFEEILKKSLNLLGHDFLKTRRDMLDLFHDNLYSSLMKKGVCQDDMITNFEYLGRNVRFHEIPLYKGTKEFFEKIKNKVSVGIVSSNRENQIKIVLRANTADKYFKLILGHDSGHSKVEKLKKAADIFGNKLSTVFYVTDTVGDIREAKEAGVNSVAVGWGWHDEHELKAATPTYFVENKKELFNLIMSNL